MITETKIIPPGQSEKCQMKYTSDKLSSTRVRSQTGKQQIEVIAWGYQATPNCYSKVSVGYGSSQHCPRKGQLLHSHPCFYEDTDLWSKFHTDSMVKMLLFLAFSFFSFVFVGHLRYDHQLCCGHPMAYLQSYAERKHSSQHWENKHAASGWMQTAIKTMSKIKCKKRRLETYWKIWQFFWTSHWGSGDMD